MVGTSEATMARPKKREKQAEPPAIKRIVVQGSLEWSEWLQEGADFCRTDVSKLFDAAVVDYLKARGFSKTPPKRTP
jgi:hypothetical protein